MTGRRAIVGLCMLCALLVSAVAAQGASAATNGTTSFTCQEVTAGTGVFNDAHCKEEGGSKSFKHVEIPEKIKNEKEEEVVNTTELEGSNETTGGARSTAVLISTQSGVAEELQAKIVEKKTGTSPWMTNAKDPTTGEHYTHGEGQLTYKEVKVIKPSEKGCIVYENSKEENKEMVSTNQLKASSKGQGMGIKFEPAEGTVFAEFFIGGCSVTALNGTYKAEGSLVAFPNGATLETEATQVKEVQKTLKLRGQTAGLGGSLTLKGRAKGSAGAYTPLSVTTVETP